MMAHIYSSNTWTLSQDSHDELEANFNYSEAVLKNKTEWILKQRVLKLQANCIHSVWMLTEVAINQLHVYNGF